ncbi:hypothetical protein [Isoptericola croceus]|uniref:hypothetical protein n=1 Tax=Isoptericola croceus TaxID=3031406 RepID=UPI0023F77939|nr:hypothetical protein [Isoptericola croceus]
MADLVSDHEELHDAGTRLVNAAQATATDVAVDAERCGSVEAAEAITQFAFMLRTDLQATSRALAADGTVLHDVVATLSRVERGLAGQLS